MFSLQQLLDAWNWFFHEPQTAETLGLFRILWGTLLTFSGCCMFPFARDYFGPNGILSASQYQANFGRSRFTLLNLLPETDRMVQWVLAIHIASSVMLTFGLFTRFSTIVAFVTILSLHHRNPAVFHSGDTIMRLITFLMIFSNAGDAYSIDQLLAETPAVAKSPWVWRLMQIQVSIVYLRTVFWKLRGTKWVNGTAAYYPTQVTAFRRFPLPAVLATKPLIALATWGTLATQISLGTLVWVDEFRYPVLILGVSMHLALDLLLELQLFSWTMMSTYVLFLPSDHLRGVVEWLGRIV